MNKKIKKALFVIDVQPDFITTGPLANPRAAKKVPNIVAKIKAHDGLCFATHDTHFTKEQVKTAWPPEQGVAYEDSLEGQKLPYPHCIKLTPGWEIEPTVLEALREKNKDGQKKFFAVDKYTFGYKEWESYLKFFEFDEIEICGFVSSICVLANAIILRAIYPNKRIVVDVNCIEDISDEGQAAAIACLKAQQIDVIGE